MKNPYQCGLFSRIQPIHFPKCLTPSWPKESQFKAHKTSLTFTADDIDIWWQIEITMVKNFPHDNIVKISESSRKHKQLKPIENYIFICKHLLDKLLKVCVQMLNTLLLPPKEDLNLSYGCYASRVLKGHSSGMSYLIDITWEPMGGHGFRFVRIFQQTPFNQTDVGNVNIPWNHFDVFTRELNGFLKTPGRL